MENVLSSPNKPMNSKLSVAQFGELEDVADLVEFADRAHSSGIDVTATWPAEAVTRIISPLLHRSPKDWPCESRRIELLETLLVDEDSIPKSAQSFMQGPLIEYDANWRVPSSVCLCQSHVTHSLNSVYPVMKPMVDKPSSEWTEGEVEAAVQLLGG